MKKLVALLVTLLTGSSLVACGLQGNNCLLYTSDAADDAPRV